MSYFMLLAWLWARPPVMHHGAAIARDVDSANAIAIAAADTRDPKRTAAKLDVFDALETHYGPADVAGGCPGVRPGTPCKREQHARYCSPWMILCSRVPVGATLVECARIAIDVLEESRAFCPAFPFGRYIGVGCHSSPLADMRAALIDREVSR